MMCDGGLGLVTTMQFQHQNQPPSFPSDPNPMSSNPCRNGRRKEDRIPQWGFHETREFIAIRADMERNFTQTKRNKTLWDLISGKMKEKGFQRSAEQCKCKWKNLVNRYKGKEISEMDNGRQCPFFDELDAIFKERARNMDRLLLESDGLKPKKRAKKLKHLGKEDEDMTDEDGDEGEESEDEILVKKRARKVQKERQRATADRCRANSMQEVLEDFFKLQQQMEEQWRESLERREQGRHLREQECREAMEKLEQDRIMREQAFWECEDQRQSREELRSQKRDELFAALINKIARED